VGAQFTLGRLAEALGATLEGDPARVILGVAPLDLAGPEHVSFLANSRYARAAARSAAAAVVVGREVEGLPQALLRVEDLVQVVDRAIHRIEHRPADGLWLSAGWVALACFNLLRNLVANSWLKIARSVTSSNRPFLKTCSRRTPSFFQPMTR